MGSQRRLVAALAERGHRAIPATNAEQAADLVQRMHFDAVFCSSMLPGLNWLELYRRIRRHVGFFALLADTPDPSPPESSRAGKDACSCARWATMSLANSWPPPKAGSSLSRIPLQPPGKPRNGRVRLRIRPMRILNVFATLVLAAGMLTAADRYMGPRPRKPTCRT